MQRVTVKTHKIFKVFDCMAILHDLTM